jgi:hypothetical protein
LTGMAAVSEDPRPVRQKRSATQFHWHMWSPMSRTVFSIPQKLTKTTKFPVVAGFDSSFPSFSSVAIRDPAHRAGPAGPTDAPENAKRLGGAFVPPIAGLRRPKVRALPSRFGLCSRIPCVEHRMRNGVKAPSTPAGRALPAHSKHAAVVWNAAPPPPLWLAHDTTRPHRTAHTQRHPDIN